MDVWEANINSAAVTPHVCNVQGQTRCSGTQCGDGDERYDGICDKDGCDFNSFRMGNQTFLGPGKTVNTNSKFTVVTQFLTSDNTTTGTLHEIRRLYVQNGKVIQNSVASVPNVPAQNSLTDSFCAAQKTEFGDQNYFATKGGMKQMGAALQKGMVLALSIWDDYSAYMQWLDSDYPTDKDATAPGVARGTCSASSGIPATVESVSSGASVTFSNIKWGDLGTTFSSTGSVSSIPSGPTSSSSSSAPSTTGVAEYGQCGGTGFSGSTTCQSPFTCHVVNPCE